jgi:hypothetical protein
LTTGMASEEGSVVAAEAMDEAGMTMNVTTET